MSAAKLFGTDGIRGVSGRFPVDESGSVRIGAAVAETIGKNSQPLRVAVARDTRQSGAFLQENLCKGLVSRGARIFPVGVCPTPAVVAVCLEKGADAAIIVSASHNPPEYNGFKIFDSEGFKISDSTEKEIEKNFEKLKDTPCFPVDQKPAGRENADWFGAYAALLESSEPGGRDLSGMKIALDCANGAMCEIAPKIFEKSGAEIAAIGCEPDGKNINKGCGSLETSPLGRTVKRYGALFGASLDGDGDRVAFCDEKGNKVNGDVIIALFARELSQRGGLKNPRIVTTIMSNKGLEAFLGNIGIEMIRADVGDKHVAELMKKETINFGGENSGHLIFSDHSTNGDGLLAALLVSDIVKRENKPLSQILPDVELLPMVLKNVRVFEQKPLNSISGLADARMKLEKKLGKAGRIHMRHSGTEPLVRILVEGENEQVATEAADEIAEIIKKEHGEAKPQGKNK